MPRINDPVSILIMKLTFVFILAYDPPGRAVQEAGRTKAPRAQLEVSRMLALAAVPSSPPPRSRPGAPLHPARPRARPDQRRDHGGGGHGRVARAQHGSRRSAPTTRASSRSSCRGARLHREGLRARVRGRGAERDGTGRGGASRDFVLQVAAFGETVTVRAPREYEVAAISQRDQDADAPARRAAVRHRDHARKLVRDQLMTQHGRRRCATRPASRCTRARTTATR